MRALLAALLAASALAGCRGATAASADGASATDAAAAGLSVADTGRVCRAAAAAIFSHDPDFMRVERVHEGAADVSYIDDHDGAIRRLRCRPRADVVEWAKIDVYGPGTGIGRWRTDPADGHMTYEAHGDRIAISQAHFNGATSRHEFTVAR